MLQRQAAKSPTNDACFAALISEVERDGNIPMLFRKVVLKLSRGKAHKSRGMRRTFFVRCNDEGCRATKHMEILRRRKKGPLRNQRAFTF